MTTTTLLKALADDTRLNVVRYLVGQSEPVPSCTLVASCAVFLNLSQPTMSHHLKKLVQAGVVTEFKRGTEKFYSLNDDQLKAVGIVAEKL